MARIKFRDQEFSVDRQERILQINAILSQYEGQRVSVRQVYYRLVAAGKIANSDKEYGKVQGLITDARYAGLIDWNAIEDRNRDPLRVAYWSSGSAALIEAAARFHKDRWITQPFYVEIHCEKAALAGILEPIANDYGITLMVNRGYNSASAMMESAQRISYYASGNAKKGIEPKRPIILYLGDHDPSGLDMVRDIRDRLIEFACPPWLFVRHIALTWEQIQEYNPPPNPAKVTDSRAAAYISQYGDSSWEVDALPPPTLDLLVRAAINAYVDKAAMEKAVANEVLVKKAIEKFTKGFVDPEVK